MSEAYKLPPHDPLQHNEREDIEQIALFITRHLPRDPALVERIFRLSRQLHADCYPDD